MNHLFKLVSNNIREYGMYIALILIWTFFNVFSDGLFMSPRNINNLFMQTGYIAVLAVGMTLIIIIRHIDLSVGYVAGFLGAVLAFFLTSLGLPVLLVIPIVLIFGFIVGVFNGSLVAYLGIPSFVVTLAGMLIFRGLLLLVTNSETILLNNEFIKLIGEGYLPSSSTNGLHASTLILGIAGIAVYILFEIYSRQKRKSYQFEVPNSLIFAFKLLVISSAIFYITWLLANYKGLPITVLIVIIVVLVYYFITNFTSIGRRIYAVGGNPEAAKLSGINVKFITVIVFGSMSMLASLAGILYTARLNSAGPSAGAMFELDAIAAAYIGGVSSAGGVGKVTSSIIGALVMASLINGMNLLGVGISLQYIIRGSVLVFAVIFDVLTRNMKLFSK